MVDVLFSMVLVMAAVLVVARVEHQNALSEVPTEKKEEQEIMALTVSRNAEGIVLDGDDYHSVVGNCGKSAARETDAVQLSIPLDGSVGASDVQAAVRCAATVSPGARVQWTYR